MAEKREFQVVIDGKETVSPAAGKASDSLGKLGDQAKDTERDFDGLDRTMREHADTITHLRQEIAKTGDTKLFGELGRNERALGKLEGLKKALSNAAGDAAPEMSLSLSSRLGPLLARLPVSGPMAVGLAAAAVPAVPIIGGAIAAGVVGGAGLGGIVGGAIIASKDARVKSAYSDLADDIGVELRQAAAPFVPAAIDAASKAGAAFDRVSGDIDDIFKDSAKSVGPLVDGIASGVERIIHGVKDVVGSASGAGPVLRELGTDAAIIGDAVGDVLTELSDNGDEGAGALRLVALGAADAIRGVGKFADITASALRPMLDFGIGAGNVAEALYGWVPVLGDRIRDGRDNLLDMKAAMDQVGSATSTTTGSIESAGVAAATTAEQVDLLTRALYDEADQALSAWDANIRYRKSLEAAREAVDKKRAVSLDEESALAALVRTTNESTLATNDNNESTATAKKRFDDARAAFVTTAEKMGYTRQKAEELADGMLKIPTKVATQVILNEAAAKRSIRNIQKAITDIHGKTVYVNIVHTGSTDIEKNDIGAKHGGVRAAGGPVKAGVQYTVGEQGRETFVAPRDGYIINNRDTALIAAGGQGTSPAPATGGRAQPIILPIQVGRASGLERMFLSWLKEAIGNAGGNPFALGY